MCIEYIPSVDQKVWMSQYSTFVSLTHCSRCFNCNSLVGVFLIFRLFNPNEIYIIKNITCMNKRNHFHNDLSNNFFLLN